MYQSHQIKIGKVKNLKYSKKMLFENLFIAKEYEKWCS